MSDPNLEDLLYDHVFGADTPCGWLVERGAFPDGWVDRYLDIVRALTEHYTGQAMLPRRVVWAVHFASWYLPLRYDDWGEAFGKSNQHTIGELARLRTPSEVFICGSKYDAGG
jgi:hypothetical protein